MPVEADDTRLVPTATHEAIAPYTRPMPWPPPADRLRRYEIAEHSMEPALHPGDYVLAWEGRRPPRRGDVVLFRHPEAPGMELVKRVVGLSGETVTIDAGRITLNGDAAADRWGHGPTSPDGSWLVPAGHVFVLGDNRALSSSDSRLIGPVRVADLRWRVVGRYGRRRR